MKKWIFLLAVVSVLIATGVGATLVNEFRDHVGLTNLETRIRDNVKEMKNRRGEIWEKIFGLRRKAGAERSALERRENERKTVDAACVRLAAKINGVSGPGVAVVPAETATTPAVLAGHNSAAHRTIEWGPHSLTRDRGVDLLTQWGKLVDEFDVQIQAGRQKIERYEMAVRSLEKEAAVFVQSVTDLETKLKELLTAREVLQVQQQVSEILANLDGRNVPGRTNELMAELQDENDRLRGQIAANGGVPGSNSVMIRPDDDLRNDGADSILQRYGIATGAPRGPENQVRLKNR